MNCAFCGEGAEVREGVCVKCGAAVGPRPARLCPECKAPVSLGEQFCAACGKRLVPDRAAQRTAAQKGAHERTVTTGRSWILAVSILTFGWGLIFWGIQRSETEKQIRQAEEQTAHLDPAERDARMKAAVGMTWREAVDHDRGQVRLLLAVNLSLSVAYFVLWRWAKRNAFAAALISLCLFVTVAVISAIVDPKTIVQGIIIKILFIAALLKAVQSAYAARKLSESAA